MTYEITSPDPGTSVTADPAVPGRYVVRKTIKQEITTVTITTVDVAELPERTVTFGYNAADGTVDGLRKMIELYGPPDVCRVFSQPGKGLIPWSSPLLALLPAECVLIYSAKDWPVPLGEWMSAKPADRFPFVWWCIDHEPEQGPSRGDPDPATYRRQWTEALDVANRHPRSAEFGACPIFTEFYARKYETVPDPATGQTWYQAFGRVLELDGVEAVGFDVYDTSWPDYRTPEHRNEIPLRYAQRAGLPLILGEWGIANKATTGDEGAAAAIRANVAYLRERVTHPVPYVAWFHNGGDSLTGRPLAQRAFREALAGNP